MIKDLINIIRKVDIRSLFTFVGTGLVGIQLLFILLHFKEIDNSKNYIDKTYNNDFMVAKFAAHAKFSFLQLEYSLEKMLSSTDQKLIDSEIELQKEYVEDFLSDLTVLKDRVTKNSEISTLVALVDREFQEYRRVEEKIVSQKEKNFRSDLKGEWSKFDIKGKVLELLNEIDDEISESSYMDHQIAIEKLNLSSKHYLLYSLVILFSFFLAFYAFNKIIISPLREVTKLFHEISNGHFEKRLFLDKYHSNMYVLADSFSRLQSKFLESLLKEETAKKALSSFLSNMSHELRTPLVSIIGFSSIALEEMEKGELSGQSKRNFDQIKKSGEHLLALINDILDLSKLNSGDFTINESKVDLVQTAQDALFLLEGKAKEKDLKLDLTVLGKKELVVIADNIRIKQIIINLVNNAIKFTKEGGVYLTIRRKEVENDCMSILFEVRDTGIGIPKEKQQDIFRSFAQAGVDSSESYSGTGLGLSISKNLIERMGGRIWVESELGIGSSFFFIIRVGLPNIKKLGRHSFDNIEERGLLPLDTNWKILIVEDDQSALLIVQHFLKKLGFKNFEHAESGESAINKVSADQYDLVLMDMNLPDMTGPNVSEALNAKSGIHCPKIVAFTASSSEIHKQKCFESGMIGFISKPVSQSGLADGIRRAQNISLDTKKDAG